MKIDGGGRRACLCGEDGPVPDAIAVALEANGFSVSAAAVPPSNPVPDVLVIQQNLTLNETPSSLPVGLQVAGEAMSRRGSGRIVVVMSAVAAVPARRFPGASLSAGASLLTVRTLAMTLGPSILVNAIGCGVIEDPNGALLSGDRGMLSHVPDGKTGAVDDIVQAVLFLCDPANSYMTGQMLTVDGGWSTGYGRDF